MGGAANRQMGGNVSFAQSLSGSSPATPLDLSYVLSTFPTFMVVASLQTLLLSWAYAPLPSYRYHAPLFVAEEGQAGQ